MIAILIGIGLWLLSVFGQYLDWRIAPEWWMNVILFASLQTIATAIIMRKLFKRGSK